MNSLRRKLRYLPIVSVLMALALLVPVHAAEDAPLPPSREEQQKIAQEAYKQAMEDQKKAEQMLKQHNPEAYERMLQERGDGQEDKDAQERPDFSKMTSEEIQREQKKRMEEFKRNNPEMFERMEKMKRDMAKQQEEYMEMYKKKDPEGYAKRMAQMEEGKKIQAIMDDMDKGVISEDQARSRLLIVLDYKKDEMATELKGQIEKLEEILSEMRDAYRSPQKMLNKQIDSIIESHQKGQNMGGQNQMMGNPMMQGGMGQNQMMGNPMMQGGMGQNPMMMGGQNQMMGNPMMQGGMGQNPMMMQGGMSGSGQSSWGGPPFMGEDR